MMTILIALFLGVSAFMGYRQGEQMSRATTSTQKTFLVAWTILWGALLGGLLGSMTIGVLPGILVVLAIRLVAFGIGYKRSTPTK